MNKLPDYKIATNTAYWAILNLDLKTLPIDVIYISKQFKNIKLKSYGEFCKKRGIDRNYFINNLASSDHGFTLRKESKGKVFFIIMYNEFKDNEIIRFTIAHELGHILLDHTKETPNANKEANCFARNLLCPIPIIEELNINNINEYCNIFDVTPVMANVSFDYKNTDLHYIDKGYYELIYANFSLATLTKEVQLDNFNANLEKVRTAFAASY